MIDDLNIYTGDSLRERQWKGDYAEGEKASIKTRLNFSLICFSYDRRKWVFKNSSAFRLTIEKLRSSLFWVFISLVLGFIGDEAIVFTISMCSRVMHSDFNDSYGRNLIEMSIHLFFSLFEMSSFSLAVPRLKTIYRAHTHKLFTSLADVHG